MKSTAERTRHHGDIATSIEHKFIEYEVPIVVRMKYGEELKSLKSSADGISFHSPSPIPLGKVVELILCAGTILVDAEITECQPILDNLGGYAVSAAYLQASPDMRHLISEEVRRHMDNGAAVR